jgi:hypothetical protein
METLNKGDRVQLSENCLHAYARGAVGTVLRSIKARGGEVQVKLDDGRVYWANRPNVKPA